MKLSLKPIGTAAIAFVLLSGLFSASVAAQDTPTPVPAESTEVPTPEITPEGTAVTIAPVTKNADWTPQFQDFDGVTMALVPPGCFMMGSDDGQDDQKPASKICFDQPFWLDKTEVTQAQFAQFNGEARNKPRFKGDDQPVENITWFEASAYCALRDARLPTEAEWEYAARGPDDLLYPWGSDFDGTKLVYKASGTSEVGSIPDGASWIGALDVSGNVWEWTSSLYKPYPYDATDGREDATDRSGERVLRGGSYGGQDKDYSGATALGTLAGRGHIPPTLFSRDVGIRCARSLDTQNS